MKTFTLRLTTEEAEALERIAAVNGTSKNTFLRSMIVAKYEEIDPKCFAYCSEILEITPINIFPASVAQAYTENNAVDEEAVLNAYSYAIGNEQDETNLQTLDADRKKFITKLLKEE